MKSLYRKEKKTLFPAEMNLHFLESAFSCFGGRDGIRTHEPLTKLTVFKTASFNRSDTLPYNCNKVIVSYPI